MLAVVRFICFYAMWLLGYEFWLFPKLFNDNSLFGDYSQLYSLNKIKVNRSGVVLRVLSIVGIVLLVMLLKTERAVSLKDFATNSIDNWLTSDQPMIGKEKEEETLEP